MTVLVGSEVIDVLHCYELLKGRLSKVKEKRRRRRVGEGVCTFPPLEVLIPSGSRRSKSLDPSDHVKSK
jgi:hypothetical protein